MPIQKTVQDTLEVAAVNGTVLSVTTFTNLELALKIILLVVSIIYTIDKWHNQRMPKKIKSYTIIKKTPTKRKGVHSKNASKGQVGFKKKSRGQG
jgi:hypothetical protein